MRVDLRHRRHRNQPAEFLQRSLIFHLEKHILATVVVEDNGLLRRLIDVNSLVPFENETTIRQHGKVRERT